MNILNRGEYSKWAKERMKKGRVIYGVKGMPPEGAVDEDGQLLTRPVNVAWRDGVTGEVFAFEIEWTFRH